MTKQAADIKLFIDKNDLIGGLVSTVERVMKEEGNQKGRS